MQDHTPISDRQRAQFKGFFQTNNSADLNNEREWDKQERIIRSLLSEALIGEINSLIHKTEFKSSIDAISEAKTDSEKLLKEIKTIKTSAQDEIAEAGIEKHAHIFENQAKKAHKENSKRWLIFGISLIVLILVLIIFGGYYVINCIEDTDNKIADKIEFSVTIALLISFLSYLVVQIFKNYFAEKHNQQINQHRANCLSSYNTFASSADGDVKKEILLQATHTIFSHQKTGYLVNESDNSNPNPVYEVVKNVTKMEPT